ncbi:MAG: YlbG family protein [Pisciglobus halotolerans]|nr:YlbG family protein [Pisciglobus halotolerans]
MEINERQGIIIWVYTLKPLKQLKRFGLIHYVSKKMKYVLLYVDQTGIEETMKTLNKLHFVRKTEVSHRPEISMKFDHILEEIQHENDNSESKDVDSTNEH